MNNDELTPEEREAVAEALKHKTGVMVCVPNLDFTLISQLTNWLQYLPYKNIDAECPWFFRLYTPSGLYPHEYARNECVREFLKDPVMKRLWFIDADMVPPVNAFDLLDFDEPMVSGMGYIWMAERIDDDGFYHPPLVKINAFKYRRQTEDFFSIVPPADGKAFYCDAAGAACLLIKREVIEDMPEPWFRGVRDPYGKSLRSEDLDFTKRATDRRHRLLYVPKVDFGHFKMVDVKQIARYGMAGMRDIIEKVKSMSPDEIRGKLPQIEFAGERPKLAEAPPQLEVISGGARG